MIRAGQDPLAQGLSIGAILLLVGSLGFMLLAPKPVGPTKADMIKGRGDIAFATSIAEKGLAQSQTYNSTKLWVGSEQDVTPQIYAAISKIAASRGVQLQSLKPQRVNDKTTPNQLPYQAVMNGTFPAMVQVGKDIESSATKFTLSSVSITSSDGASDKVVGSIGVVVYLSPPVPVAPVKATDKAKVKVTEVKARA